MMRAAVFAAPESIRIESVPIPDPGPGEVRVKVEGCGLCGSNLPVFEGRPWFQYPRVPGAPGHEAWGIVDAAGKGAGAVREGDRVTLMSCKAYAEYDVTGAENVIPLPAVLDQKPFPGEPLGCAMNVFHRSDIRPGQTVAVIGIGFLGALITRLAKNAGAVVIAISRRPFALRTATRCGADHAVRLGDVHQTVENVLAITGGVHCDRVIEATGFADPLKLAGELTGVRGRLIIAGYHQDGLREVDMQLWNWRGLDVVCAHERDPGMYVRGVQSAVAAVADNQLDPFPLFTHRFEIENIEQAFRAMQQRPEGFLKALIVF